MNQHTPGRLKIGRIDHENQHVEIDAESTRAYLNCFPWENLATCYGEERNPERGSAVMEANARRLVAAWNACEGISTDELETTGGAAVGWTRTASKLIHATKQCDELITALAACRDAMPPSEVDISEAIGYPTSVPAYVRKSVALLVAQRGGLLTALEHALQWNDDSEPTPTWVYEARAAIAKVQGGEA